MAMNESCSEPVQVPITDTLPPSWPPPEAAGDPAGEPAGDPGAVVGWVVGAEVDPALLQAASTSPPATSRAAARPIVLHRSLTHDCALLSLARRVGPGRLMDVGASSVRTDGSVPSGTPGA